MSKPIARGLKEAPYRWRRRLSKIFSNTPSLQPFIGGQWQASLRAHVRGSVPAPPAAALRASGQHVGHGHQLFLMKLNRCYETSVARAILPEGVISGTALTSAHTRFMRVGRLREEVRL